jgi:glycosyltransferase involved in cell wall biosynthesis
MVKILHLITTIERGGAEKQLLLLAQLQIKHRNIVYVAPLKGHPSLQSEFTSSGARVYTSLLGNSFLLQTLKLRILIKRHKFDIVHAHLPRAELIGAVSSCFMKSKFVITKHNSEQFWPSKNRIVSNMLGKFVFRIASRIIVISEAVLEELVRLKEIVDIPKIKLIPYGFQGTSTIYRSKNFKQSSPILRICTVSRLVPQKNLEVLLQACKILTSLGVSISVRIIGEGVLGSQLKSLANSLGLKEIVDWPGGGYIDPFESILDYDVFVLPSVYEGFGLVLLEALERELTVVASGTSAIPEVLGSDYPLLFNPNDPVALTQRILESANPNFREFLKQHRANTLIRFAAEKMVLETENIYREVTGVKC